MTTEKPMMSLRHETHYGRVVRAPADRPANVYAMFSAAVERAAGKLAAIDGDARTTYAELRDLVERSAGRMAALGVGFGDRVALLIDNRTDFLAAMLATARIGAVVVPMNIRQRLPETEYALNDCGATLVIHEASVADQVPNSQQCPALKHRIVVDEERRLWDGEWPAPSAQPEIDEDTAFCILYTSGTTGRPKGAILTHFGVVTNCIGAAYGFGLGDDECTILAVPASHVTGVHIILLVMVFTAGKSVMMRGFKARRFLEMAETERMTYNLIVPAMYKLCLMDETFDQRDLSSWRVGAYGGAPMPAALAQELGERLPCLSLMNVYGATETTSPAVMMPPELVRLRLNQVGKTLPYVDIVIMDDNGREVPRGEQGEIWISGPVIIPEYWNKPDANRDNFMGGYWKSGDLGAMDKDGFLSVFDRKKDMINRGGFKIYSVEVENTIMGHPAVVEAGVVGKPCPVLGERVEAFAVLKEPLDERVLKEYCAARLSDYKVPDNINFVDGPLPRNPNGKLLKTALREWLKEKA